MLNKYFYLFLGLIIVVNYACKIDEPSIPEATGISGARMFVSLTASPDVLVINGISTSSINAKVSDYTGKPLAGRTVQFEVLNINFYRVDIGKLAKDRVATNSSGIAHTVYKVPSLNEQPQEVTVAIKATLVDADYADQFYNITYLYLVLPNNVPKPLPYNCDATKGGPQPFITYSPSAPKANQRINFSGATSFDVDGNIISYDWNFGDGRTASGPYVWHSYSLEGSYTVILVVTDNDHNACPTSTTVSVGSVLGCAINGVSVEVGKTASISITISSGIPDYSVTIDFGDGSPQVQVKTSQPSVTVSHIYTVAGTYIVTARVKDGSGRTYTCAGVVVVTVSAPFGCNVPAVTGTVGTAVAFTVTLTGGTPNYTYVINYGDGSPNDTATTSSSSATFNHIYSAAGTYSVTVTVTDGASNSTVCSTTATIS